MPAQLLEETRGWLGQEENVVVTCHQLLRGFSTRHTKKCQDL